MDIGALLRYARLDAGLTLRALSERAATSHSALAAYEANRRVPRADTMLRVLEATGLIDLSQRTIETWEWRVERGRELEKAIRTAGAAPVDMPREMNSPRFGIDRPSASGVTIVPVRGGDIETHRSWIYAWLLVGDDRPVVYVGSTNLSPTVRTWLHLHHDDPDIGRVRDRAGPVAQRDIDVLAAPINEHIDRKHAKSAAIRRLRADGLLSEHYFGDASKTGAWTSAASEFAREFAAQIRLRDLVR